MIEPVEASRLILIIDDHVETIRLLSAILQDQGQIIFATSGAAGLELARQRRPQLILLDVEMANMDGYEVCRRLKADPDTRNCAVMFVTAHNNMDSEVKALEAGAVDFITKPFNPPVVLARVRTHMKLQCDTEHMAQLAHRDGLTGLFNRRYFDDCLHQEFHRHQRHGLPLGLAFIDIDHFKAYNDGYGHLAGDACLREIARAIGVATRRPGEIVARYGGEEFVAILPYTPAQDALKYGDWLCNQVRMLALPHAHSGCAAVVTISVGVAVTVPKPGTAPSSLVGQADEALYSAKSAGRDRSVSSTDLGVTTVE